MRVLKIQSKLLTQEHQDLLYTNADYKLLIGKGTIVFIRLQKKK